MDELPEAICSDCAAFRVESRDDTGRFRGRCRIRVELGMIPDHMPACHVAQIKTDRADKVRQPKSQLVQTRHKHAGIQKSSYSKTGKNTLHNPTQGDTTGDIQMDRNGLKQVLRELLEEETLFGYPDMGARWEGGTLSLNPADPNLQSKEIALGAFFHKIVMVRDRLRVLEAKINTNEKLSEQDKIELQGYITKCYGSLTTFNILFSDKSDHFKSK